jgi:hypothetical protein
VTRQVQTPAARQSSPFKHVRNASSQKTIIESATWSLPPSGLPRPESQQRKAFEQTVYTSIHDSNLFKPSTPEAMARMAQRESADSSDSVYSPMGALSAIPDSLYNDRDKHDEILPVVQAKKSSLGLRYPSYEGNDYQGEICSMDIHTRNVSDGSRSVGSVEVQSKLRSRLPASIRIPPPYDGQLLVATNNIHRNYAPPKPKAVPWPGESPPRPLAWPGFDDSLEHRPKASSAFAPPIPAKSPERWATKRGQQSELLLREEAGSHDMVRIVSKENIRAALGGVSRESSMEDMRVHPAARAKNVPSRIASPPRLETYNTHMFPRKDVRPGEKFDQ